MYIMYPRFGQYNMSIDCIDFTDLVLDPNLKGDIVPIVEGALVHRLHDNWNVYYHLPQDKNWALTSYVPIIECMDTAEKVMVLNDAISDNIIKYCMLFAMKQGITPMWEDKKNRTGGCFSYKVINRVVPDVWRELMYKMCGNTLTVNRDHMHLVNGITISPKKNFSIVKVWMTDCSLQDPMCIENIPHLVKNGCMFRKHEPEF